MTPPKNTPAAPPAPFIAPQSPIARCRAAPSGNDEVIAASDPAAISAPPKPCTPRATIRSVWSGAVPPASDASAKISSAATSVRRWPN